MIDQARDERESLRWMILLALNQARPTGTSDYVLVRTAHNLYIAVTTDVIQRELDYLSKYGLLEVKKRPDTPIWHAELTALGIDIVEYRAECPSGIARPPKW
jgi:hypothetical protein